MPEKSASLRARGKSAVPSAFSSKAEPSGNDNFLKIGPALPSVSAKRVPQRLNQRSHSTLNSSVLSTPYNGSSKDSLDLGVTVMYTGGEANSLQICRSHKEREQAPDRIALDRRGLTNIPAIVGEPGLRLLSLQHNLISNLQGLQLTVLDRLVLLDIYDNQIEKVDNIESLVSLRVLLLGKNRIRHIDNLTPLTRLEVLDLHGNQLNSVDCVSGLTTLKVLNLAGNQIRVVGKNDLLGLKNLRELNMKRNRLRKLHGCTETPELTKLFLGNNELQSVEDILSVATATNLQEIQIQNNPISSSGEYVSFLVSHLPNLTSLSEMQVTDKVRSAAMAWRKTKEIVDNSVRNSSKDTLRESVISNARTNWELLRSQSKCLTTNTPKNLKNSGLKPECDFVVTAVSGNDGNSNNKTLKNGNKNAVLKSKTAIQNFIRLPPILVPFVTDFKEESSSDSVKRCSSNSSVNPNVDSGSSSDSVDSSDSEKASRPNFPKQIRSKSIVQKKQVDSKSLDNDKLTKNIIKHETMAKQETSVAKASENNDNLSNISGKNFTADGKPDLTKIKLIENSNEKSSANISSIDSMNKLPQCAGQRTDSDSNVSQNGSKLTISSNSSEISMPKTEDSMSRQNVRSAVIRNRNINHKLNNRAMTAKPKPKVEETVPAVSGREREQGGDYLIEICGRHLNIFGQGSLRFIDKPWHPLKANDVTNIKFSYVNFNSAAGYLHRLKTRFPNAEHFTFSETNITVLAQLNALAEIQGLISLQIDDEGNPIAQKCWQNYAIFRLSHWGLKTVNGHEITESDIAAAESEYSGLSSLVLLSLPDDPLQPLLTRLHLDSSASASQLSARQWLWDAEPALRSVVAKEALQWRRNCNTGQAVAMQEDMVSRQKSRAYLSTLLENTCDAVIKLQQLENDWPNLLVQIVKNTLIDYSQIDTYVKQKLLEL